MYETVIRSAVNYDLIVNYKSSSFITNRIKEFYLEKIKYEIEDIELFDTIIGKYLMDDDFYEFFHENIINYHHPDYGIDYYYGMDYILKNSFEIYNEIPKEIVMTKWI